MIRWEIIPQNRSRLIIRSICNFKTRGERERLRLIREEDYEYNDVKGMKEESRGKKVDQF